MSWTLSQSGSALFARAGVGASTKLSGSSILTQWSNEAEALLSARTRKDWVADYAKIKTNYQQVLSDVITDMIASKIAANDVSDYNSPSEQQTILDVLKDNIDKLTSDLKDKSIQEVME